MLGANPNLQKFNKNKEPSRQGSFLLSFYLLQTKRITKVTVNSIDLKRRYFMENENGNQNQQTTEVKNEEVGKNAVTQTEQKTEEKVEKKFTQDELNSYLKKEKDKLLKDMPSKEELKAYKDWKEAQKTAEQKQAEKETEYQNTLTNNKALDQENKALRAGVNVDDLDYVIFKVSKMEGEFSDNLDSFLKDNPKYLASSNTNVNENSTINLGGDHNDKGMQDLSKMSYQEYKAYRKKENKK